MLLNKNYLFYYAMLFLVLVSWHNPYETPPGMYRVAFLMALLGPTTIKKPQLLAVVIPLFYAISNYSCYISYMPNQVYLYLIFPFVGLMLYHRKIAADTISFMALIVGIYTFFINAVYSQRFEPISACCFLIFLLHKFFPQDKNCYAHLYSYAFAIISLTLSLLFIASGSVFQSDYGAGGFERTEWMDPNYFGCVIGVGVVASMIELMYNKKLIKIENILFLSSISFSLYVLVLNGSRGALLATFVAFIVLFLGNGINLKKKVLILSCLCVFLYVLYEMGIFEFLIYRMETDSGGGSGRTYIWGKKLFAYNQQLSIIEKIFGIGYNEGMRLGFGYPRGFHNDYIAILVEYGIVGLLFYQIIGNCSSIVTTDDVVYEYWQNNESSSQRRFSESQIDSYLFTCKEQALIAGKYKSLEVFIGQFVARSIVVLYEKGCHKEMIQRYVNKYVLSKYDTYISLLKLFPLKIAVKYCIKKMICPMIRKNY